MADEFTATVNLPEITPAQAVAWHDLVGRTNDAPFCGYQPGEVMFLSAFDGIRPRSDDRENKKRSARVPGVVVFRFSVNFNPVWAGGPGDFSQLPVG